MNLLYDKEFNNNRIEKTPSIEYLLDEIATKIKGRNLEYNINVRINDVIENFEQNDKEAIAVKLLLIITSMLNTYEWYKNDNLNCG